jgi:hypothetical protein
MKLSQINEATELVLANKARFRIVLENDLYLFLFFCVPFTLIFLF